MKTKLTRQQLALIAVLLIAFALLKAGLIWWYLNHKTPHSAPPVTVSCSNLQAGCSLPDGSLLRLDSAPQAARPFGLTLSHVPAAAPGIAFAMRDMDMGFNSYKLLPQGADFVARITLPVCVSGSRQWQMTLKYPDKSYLIDFSTR
ncbi:hypothetical protein [Vogesella sp. LIG4]|uniref:hypothetical protein n=1 Tax=Vogesella sp. LIG4 TaxID=1192162 RepID=UPI00081FED86|nr:hypothetical protein [Vogesella sp. LIG4]SCK04865.1 hypothetical protein PSELUDRAFT_0026 [Vogesella sp. LIG4]